MEPSLADRFAGDWSKEPKIVGAHTIDNQDVKYALLCIYQAIETCRISVDSNLRTNRCTILEPNLTDGSSRKEYI